MLVTATNLAYLPYTELWLRSVTKIGRVRPKDICIMVFGTSAECAVLEVSLRRQARGLSVLKLNPADPQFEFLRIYGSSAIAKHIGNVWFSDYARAWFGSQIERYVWLDADTLAQGPLDELMALRASTSRLMIAAEKSRHFKGRYFETYVAAHRQMPLVHLDEAGVPLTYNSGVLVVDRDYSRQWRRQFDAVALLATKRPKTFKRLLLQLDLAQMVWNFVAWRARAEVLDPKFNTLSIHDRENATIVHYHKGAKTKMVEDFVARGLLSGGGR